VMPSDSLRSIRGGLEFLRRWHSVKNYDHPLRVAERADALAWAKKRETAQKPVISRQP